MPVDYLSILVTAVVAGGSAYFGSYLKKKGENLATHEDVGKLVEQVAAVTQTTKEIESTISGDLWDRQKRWEIKRDAFFEAIKALTELEDAVSILDSRFKAAKMSPSPTPEEFNGKVKASHQSWSRASLGYRKATRLAEVVADKETNQVFRNIGFFLTDITRQILVGDLNAFTKGLPRLLEESGKLIAEIRKELNVDLLK
jgi:hypothetical protein